MISKALFNSKDQTWGTPPELFKALSNEFGPFQLDAATRESNPLKTPYYYTEEMDALAEENRWLNPTYVNPPYGRNIIKWIKKAYEQSILGNLVVMFIPARTDTIWFHRYIYNRPRVEFRLLKGRYSMWNYDINQPHPHKAPFPSMIVIFRP